MSRDNVSLSDISRNLNPNPVTLELIALKDVLTLFQYVEPIQRGTSCLSTSSSDTKGYRSKIYSNMISLVHKATLSGIKSLLIFRQISAPGAIKMLVLFQ